MLQSVVKTTIEIDAQLLRLVKLKAVKERKSLKTIVHESLTKEVGITPSKQPQIKPQIGSRHLGGIKAKFSRIDLYEDL